MDNDLAQTYTRTMSKKTKPDDRSVGPPDWDSLLLICKDCRRRKDGPKHLKTKALAKSLKTEMKANALQARIVLTSCLKLCPKKATSVAFVAGLANPRIAAIKSCAQLETIMPLLVKRNE
jgi:hypothetical protein